MLYMIGDRIKELREDLKLSMEAFGAIVGTSKQYVNGLEKGANQRPNGVFLEGWARHCGVNIRWLVSGTGKKRASATAADPTEWADILGVRQAAALGDGAEPDEYAETHKLKFRADSLRRKHLRPDKLAVIYGKGDSMYPTIKSGDAILVDTSDTEPQDEKLFVVTQGRDLFAKRLVRLGDRWFIDSDNKADPKWKRPIPIDEADGFEIHGRVRWVGSWED